MKSEQYIKTLNSLTFTLALWIAVGLIVVGIVVSLWPVECESSFFAGACALTWVRQVIRGLIMTIPGIILLLMRAMSNSHHRILAIIGILGIFLSLFYISSVLVINIENGYVFEPIIFIFIGVIEIFGFLCAAGSACTKLKITNRPPTNNLVSSQ
jgi:hypothetical protein